MEWNLTMYALIQKSDNSILRVAPEGPQLAEEKPFYWLECPDDCKTNWAFDGIKFNSPIIPEPEISVPNVVSMRQARLALLQAELLTLVQETVAAGDEAGKITWEYATEVRRADLFVVNLSTSLALTEEQLDFLFSLAATL